jgi:hypothetical protein
MNLHAALMVVGVRVAHESAAGRGYERIDYTFMQCSMCGSVCGIRNLKVLSVGLSQRVTAGAVKLAFQQRLGHFGFAGC